MTKENRALAIEIIASSNSCKAAFNVPVKDHYSSTHEILILESNASVVALLVAKGFSLYMTKKGLSVTKF